MALEPWGGKHADLLHSLRSQRANQLTGGDYPGLRETVLPMPGRAMRPHLGVRVDVQTLPTCTDATPGNSPGRANQEFAGRTAAGAISASRRLATRLIVGTASRIPSRLQIKPTQCHHRALFCIRGPHIAMPATQAYKPPTLSHVTHPIVARRYPRSGRLPGKSAPKNSSRAAQTCPRSPPVKFAHRLGAPNCRFVPVRSPARSAGYLAWVQGTALPLGGRAARAPHKKLSVAN